MGCLNNLLKKLNQNTNNQNNNNSDENAQLRGTDSEHAPFDHFICTGCDKTPEILSVHSDNGKIEIKCKYHNFHEYDITNYFEETKKYYLRIKCINCKNGCNSPNDDFYFCTLCKKNFCQNCSKIYNGNNDIKHKPNHAPYCVKISEKSHRCLDHLDSDINSYCEECQKNICDKDLEDHKDHIHQIFKLTEDINEHIKTIEDKNKKLKDIIRFNETIIKSYKKFPNDYFNIKSLKNLGQSIKAENKRNNHQIECMMNNFEKKIKNKDSVIKKLRDKYEIELKGDEEKLSLSKRGIDDEALFLISQIPFDRLEEIDLSGNNITNIESLNNMNLPHLKAINLSFNKIENINSVANLNCPKLGEVLLQNNQIKDIEPFKNSTFKLNIMRLENNQLEKDFKEIREHFKGAINLEERTPKDFSKKYGREIDLNKKILDLKDLRKKDILLRDLYFVINYNNIISELYLNNNEIRDASLLSRMPLVKLKILDLSLNLITNLQFIVDMQLPNLHTIFLNHNKINDLYPIIQINKKYKKTLKKLKVISLKNNNLDREDYEIKYILDLFKDKDITYDLYLD